MGDIGEKHRKVRIAEPIKIEPIQLPIKEPTPTREPVMVPVRKLEKVEVQWNG